jgi:hypothetical protein
LKTVTLEAVAGRGYFSGPEILACHEAGIAITLPKPGTSGAKSDGRFGKQDYVYLGGGRRLLLPNSEAVAQSLYGRRRWHEHLLGLCKGALTPYAKAMSWSW